MTRLVEFTGGAKLMAGRRGRAAGDEAFLALSAALQGHYVLGYVPAETAGGRLEAFDERAIDVRVKKSGYDVSVASQIVRAVGSSYGSAMNSVLRGAQEMAIGRMADAVGSFTTAVSIAPDLGIAHYGLGTALSMEGRGTEAVGAFQRALATSPWLPDLDARLTELNLRIGKYNDAWKHALAARAAGSDVAVLLDRLQTLAPREVASALEHRGPRVFVVAGRARSLEAQLVLPRILGALSVEVRDSPGLILAANPESRDFLVYLANIEAEQHREGIGFESQVVLRDRDGRDVQEIHVEFGNALSPADVTSTAKEVAAAIEEALAGRYERP